MRNFSDSAAMDPFIDEMDATRTTGEHVGEPVEEIKAAEEEKPVEEEKVSGM